MSSQRWYDKQRRQAYYQRVFNWGFLYTCPVRLLIKILISLAGFLIRLLRRNKMPTFRR